MPASSHRSDKGANTRLIISVSRSHLPINSCILSLSLSLTLLVFPLGSVLLLLATRCIGRSDLISLQCSHKKQDSRFCTLHTNPRSHTWRQTRSAREAFPPRRHAMLVCVAQRHGTTGTAPPSQRSDWHHHSPPQQRIPQTAQTTSCTQNPALLSRHKSSAKVRWLILLFNKVVICCHHRNRGHESATTRNGRKNNQAQKRE